ncbi:PREDICTED: transcription initiation factor TFIID subunit 4b isoform X3 [Tarenaya hassleriana]|uniref:transcription initiation factor TFIID subunit 4b isoform X3 n=1 Tax=Tarenaya hassleriana TaxID=28532 RepID=UPI00053CA1B9|nr:PREDICTED: transcription initiation factor TFIID subunit 4b isoform X3 [Tarenaya hassleriana]
MSTSQFSGTNTGSNHSSSQAFLTWENVNGDANTNLHRQPSLESAQMKEQQGSALENERQNGVKCAKNSHLQHNQPQDHRESGQLWERPLQVSQTPGLQVSEKNPLSTKPKRSHNQESESMKLQKMSSQQARAMKQPVDPRNRDPRKVSFSVFLQTLQALLDKDRAMQLHILSAKLQRNEISKDVFGRHMRDIVDDQIMRLAYRKLQQPNSHARPVTSPAGVTVKRAPKNRVVCQKKPPRKKQKVTGPSTNQSIGQLNGVAAVSGVNLREVEEPSWLKNARGVPKRKRSKNPRRRRTPQPISRNNGRNLPEGFGAIVSPHVHSDKSLERRIDSLERRVEMHKKLVEEQQAKIEMHEKSLEEQQGKISHLERIVELLRRGRPIPASPLASQDTGTSRT